jgi:sensor histidine kinase YesM
MMPSLLKFIRTNFITIIWLTVAGFVMGWFIWRGCCERISAYVWISFFNASLWIALWMGNAYVSQLMNHFFSWHKEPIKRMIGGLIAMVVYTLSAVYGIVLIFQSFGFSVGDNLRGTYLSTIGITLLITMFMTARDFFINWRQAAVDAEVSKRESVKAQYENLKSQVNPHFLFNSLNALTSLVYQDQDKAVKFIKQLSTVYRYVLDTRDKELVSLNEEIEFLQSYLFLQQIRFGEKLKLSVELNGEGLGAPLVLQMLVENAIKHNIIAEEQPLTIRIYREELMLVVENNLQKKSIPSDESTGAGLENIKKRYSFLSSIPVSVDENERRFKVSVPVIRSEQ